MNDHFYEIDGLYYSEEELTASLHYVVESFLNRLLETGSEAESKRILRVLRKFKQTRAVHSVWNAAFRKCKESYVGREHASLDSNSHIFKKKNMLLS